MQMLKCFSFWGTWSRRPPPTGGLCPWTQFCSKMIHMVWGLDRFHTFTQMQMRLLGHWVHCACEKLSRGWACDWIMEHPTLLMPMTDAQETCTRNWYQFLAPNRTCSIRYQNLVREKIYARLHVIRTRNRYQFFWYRFLERLSLA